MSTAVAYTICPRCKRREPQRIPMTMLPGEPSDSIDYREREIHCPECYTAVLFAALLRSVERERKR